MSNMNPVLLLKVAADIARVGQSIIATHDDQRSFAYTIGLTELGLPEIILFGARPQYAAFFLNSVAAVMKNVGEFKDGDISTEFSELPTAFKSVTIDAVGKYAIQAIAHYEGHTIVSPCFMQMVMPDRAGLLPWQPGYDNAYMDKFQPRLWEVA